MEDKELTEAQRKFLEYCQKIGWGKIEVIIKNGEPVMAIQAYHNEKFD